VSFARPDLLPLLLLLPLAVVVAGARRRRRAAAQLGDPATISRLGGAGLLRFPARSLVLLTVAAAALALAASGPRWGRRVAEGESNALNLVLALDVSKSMLRVTSDPAGWNGSACWCGGCCGS
jgi:Ca-activated chloride channel family protein